MSYIDGINNVVNELPIKEGSFLITGATGLIGSCIVDTLIEANKKGAHFNIYAMSRSETRLKQHFQDKVIPIIQDISSPLIYDIDYDYIIHCASNSDPVSYATNPVETILTNILGNNSVLNYCKTHIQTRMMLTSTFEVYGSIPGVPSFKEEMSGIINQTLLRNGYAESKRCSELLVRSYVDEYNVDAVISRLPSVYGPTMRMSDSKAHAQFVKNALRHENIILKSDGKQIRSYLYVIDAVSGIFKILFFGKKGEVYNISNENSVASIFEVAKECAKITGNEVIFALPDNLEAKGFSEPADHILDNSKIKSMGWSAKYTIAEGLKETLDYLRQYRTETIT